MAKFGGLVIGGLMAYGLDPLTLSLSFMDGPILTMLQMLMIDAASLGAVRP